MQGGVTILVKKKELQLQRMISYCPLPLFPVTACNILQIEIPLQKYSKIVL